MKLYITMGSLTLPYGLTINTMKKILRIPFWIWKISFLVSLLPTDYHCGMLDDRVYFGFFFEYGTLIHSSHAASSNWCFVFDQIEYTIGKNIYIILEGGVFSGAVLFFVNMIVTVLILALINLIYRRLQPHGPTNSKGSEPQS